jgi:Tol biopolymer transport system component
VWWFSARVEPGAGPEPRLQRLTDAIGIEESPALSPDGRMVAFVAPVAGRRQVWVRLRAGGAPLQITKDEPDHLQPRWAPDSNALIYYTPGGSPDEEGTIWEVPALGGVARPVTRALGGGDVSPDGRRILVFQYRDGQIALTAAARDGSGADVIRAFPVDAAYMYPRWGPDGMWTAFQSVESADFDKRIYVLSGGGDLREVAHGVDLRGLSWVPDGSGLVYASSLGSTVLYPPTFNLRFVTRDGTGDRAITFGDASYVEPDVQASGVLVASRVRSSSNIWRFPVNGNARANTLTAVRITRQTSLAQTPSVSPDGKEIVYLSDSGGHGNLWIAQADGSGSRQLTFERDDAVAIGVPVWSPGEAIAFIITRDRMTAQWLVNRDGSGLRQFVRRGVWSHWSPDGRWLYYTIERDGDYCIEKAPIDSGEALSVRCGGAASALSPDGRTLYFAAPLRRGTSGWDWEIRKASPEDGPFQALARITGAQVPVDFLNVHTIPSPDGRWLAQPLSDGVTTDLWALSTDDGTMRRLTDFADRPVVIARRVSWSPDGQSVYAAVAELDADVVALEGLLPR